MSRFASKDRKLIMHAAHPFVGVSRIAPSVRNEQQWIAPLSIDVFSTAKEQALSRQLVERMLLFCPKANWLMQSHFDGELHGEFPFESDCVIILGGTMPFSPKLIGQFASFAQRGGALVAINAGGQTSPVWKEFAQKTLEARFEDALPTSEKMSLRIAPGRHFHPVVQDVPSWEIDHARTGVLDSRAELFLEGVGSMGIKPVAWGIDTGRNRTFCTLLGTSQDFGQSSFFRLVWNALHWTLELT